MLVDITTVDYEPSQALFDKMAGSARSFLCAPDPIFPLILLELVTLALLFGRAWGAPGWTL